MPAIERCKVAFREAMDDDFNTSVAIAELQRLKSDVNKLLSQGLSTEARRIAREAFRSLGNCLGLFQLDKWQFSQVPVGQAADLSPASPIIMRQKVVMIDQGEEADTPQSMVSAAKPKSDFSDTQVQLKVDERNEARKQKDFKKADEIRQFLASNGVVIEDKPDGTSRWKR
jgi:cysteinyl-tRNA synthetase